MEEKIIPSEDIKRICKNILEFFSDYCRKNGLTFFLGYGTALGAVRHRGFIPWDDDIDVMMPRPDYERLISMFDNSTENYLLLVHAKDKHYYYPFAKLCDKKTILVEEHYSNDTNMGIYIDIFPLDGNGTEHTEAKKHLKKCIKTQQKLNNAMAKHFFRSNSNFIIEIIRYLRYRFLKLVGSEYFFNKLDLFIKKYSYDNSKYISNNSWCTYAARDLFEKSMFQKSMDIEFEGKPYPIPENYDVYLSSLYGEYMKLPPEEMRISHHDMVAYYRER